MIYKHGTKLYKIEEKVSTASGWWNILSYKWRVVDLARSLKEAQKFKLSWEKYTENKIRIR